MSASLPLSRSALISIVYRRRNSRECKRNFSMTQQSDISTFFSSIHVQFLLLPHSLIPIMICQSDTLLYVTPLYNYEHSSLSLRFPRRKSERQLRKIALVNETSDDDRSSSKKKNQTANKPNVRNYITTMMNAFSASTIIATSI